MLQRLVIQNYVLIEELDIELSQGLCVITGETGAGKSIVMGALALILGQRADSQAILNADKKCIVEGTFLVKDYPVQGFFNVNELDYADVTTIRREITADGKSRAFINDTPATLNQLKELGNMMVDIHSQHETLTLNNSLFQLSVVDAYAVHNDVLIEYQNQYKQYSQQKDLLESLLEKEKKSKLDQDYLQFQFNELEEAKLDGIDQTALEQELQTLTHADEIKTSLARGRFALNEGETNLIAQLGEISTIIQHITKFHADATPISDRLKSTYIELKDICNEIDSEEQRISIDPNRVEVINALLDNLYKVQQKHKLTSVAELIQLREQISEQLSNINSLENEIAHVRVELAAIKEQLKALATQLSTKRTQIIPTIEQDVKRLLTELSMANAELKVEQETMPEDQFTPMGIDKIRFLFSANKGYDFKELSKVASGGELSRLMLCVKALIAELTSLPTIVFDEIDTGISGEVALKVGNLMAALGKARQVIAITHLPQMAARGQVHYFVYKNHHTARTTSSIRKLSPEERITEIAKMLSGENPGQAAMQNAQELLLN